jgi:hypothetical protein
MLFSDRLGVRHFAFTDMCTLGLNYPDNLNIGSNWVFFNRLISIAVGL